MTPEERIIVALNIQDRANMVAINFAGKIISSGDSTYDCLRYDVANAIREIMAEAIKEERKACREIGDSHAEGCREALRRADSENQSESVGFYEGQITAAELISREINARSEGNQS